MEKEHEKTTLMSWKKEQLVEHIQCLEHNNNALEERFEIQYKNFWLLVNDIRHKVCKEIRAYLKEKLKPIHSKLGCFAEINREDLFDKLDQIEQGESK